MIHYERRLQKHSSSHALRTSTPQTLVKSCITNEDSTYTRQVMHYERGLHIHSSSHASRTRTPRTLVKSCITNEDATYTSQVIHYERGRHIHSSGHAVRTRTIYWLLPEQSRVDNYRATRLKRDFDDGHENLYLYLNMCVTINYQIHDILATRMGFNKI